jgi:outer membrane protein OmpA-like peptidoglycan-associated protein
MMKRLAASLAAALALAAAPRAAAEDPTARGFDPDTARLALSLEGGFAVETASAAPAHTRHMGVVLDYASGLLALKLGDERDDLLASRLSLNLLAGWSFGPVEVAVDLPMALRQSTDFSMLERQGVSGSLVDPVSASALGDLRLGAKVPIFDASRFPVGLAAMLDARLPTGNGDAFYGDGLAFTPSVIATRTLGRVRLDGQVGYLFRERGQYAQLVVHDMVVYGAGATVKLPSLRRLERWSAIGEVVGGWPRGNDLDTQRYRAPLSARAGVRWFVSRALSIETGAGTGIGNAGFGRERWRVFAGVRWNGVPLGGPDEDPDRDGIPNSKDQCPLDAGPADLDGCPDTDGDTIPDREDRCPHEPGPAQNEGCPVKEEEPLVEIETERLSLKDAIHFDTGLDTIKPESFKVLDEIARILQEHPELKKVRVEGHTDNVGGAKYNKDLSERRASAVVRYLSGKNLGDRLVPAGFGFEKPIASNHTAGGRAKNRRVEFTILGEK